jgi:DNA-binding LytR/AlgR family response regulator
MMKTLIADDEPVARQLLREHLERFPFVSIVGEAANGAQVAEQVSRLHPDLLLLDIQMPGLDGFATLRALQPAAGAPEVIFVTAHDEHALEAFNVGAADYVLKPVRAERLAAALERARKKLEARPPAPPAAAASAVPPQAEPLRKIVGRLGAEYHMLDPAEVIAFQAEGEIVRILSTRGRFLASATLKALEERLPPKEFRRIHRQTIINTRHIRSAAPLSSKRWLVKMTGGLEMIVSKRMASAIREETAW